jgi:TRAP-type C4-dicarboxylate transport system substrate-binding protein
VAAVGDSYGRLHNRTEWVSRMWKTMMQTIAVLLAVSLPGLAATGCGADGAGGGDKAGGSNAPVELSLGYGQKANDHQPDEPMVRYFADRVAKLSDGRLKVRVVFDAAGQDAPDVEERVAGMVRSGRFELGWVATRAWDRLGVKSFQALQAPFLITDYGLLAKVVTSPMGSEMLNGLGRTQLAGLAIVPELLRHPIGLRHKLVSVADFRGARIRDIPSQATDAIFAALGATPVHVGSDLIDKEFAKGRIDGEETSIARARGGWTLSGNVAFFAKANTLFANPAALQRLSEDQRSVLRTASRETVTHFAGALPSDRLLAQRYCSAGHVAFASDAQLAGLRRAVRPVYDQLGADPQTRSLIDRIQRLKRTQPASSEASPQPCEGASSSSGGGTRAPGSPSALDGTYRWRITAEGARKVGVPDDDEDIGNIATMTLRGGKWMLGDDSQSMGTFAVAGDRLVFTWPSAGGKLTFTFQRSADGSLDVKPVLPMDPGDRLVWASAPWRRVGPPVRTIP